MKSILLNLLLILSLNIFSQSKFNSENFQVTRGDLETNIYEKDTTANALVIYEFGNSYFDDKDFRLKSEVKRKIKILNRKGYEEANIVINLYNNKNTKEQIKDLKATTFNLVDGKVVSTRINPKNIFTEKYDDNNTLIKFALPNIQEGTVITYSYKLILPFTFKYQEWHFQSDIPKLYSEYRTSIPANYDYNIKLVGFLKLSKHDRILKRDCLEAYNGGSADCTNTTYVMESIPAFIDEDYMTSKDNYLSRIDYELMTFLGFDGTKHNYTKTWKNVDKELKSDENIGRQLNKKIDVSDFIDKDLLSELDQLKKSKGIYNYVQENYTWNKKNRIFKDVSVKNLLKNKSGNISSINILLHNMLKESGIDVKPVLLSTRQNGFPTKIFPVISDFNYLIVKTNINNETYFLDATDKYLSFGQIPFKCLNEYGRLLDFKNGSYWVDIKIDEISTVQHQIELAFNEDQNILGEINSRYTGYHALPKKRNYYENSIQYLEAIENDITNINITNHEVTSNGIDDVKFQETFTIEYNEDDNKGDKIYLNPFTFKFFTENPFKLQERSYPIDFGYKDAYIYSFTLDTGNAYEVIDIPEGINVKLPNDTGEFIFSSELLNNNVKLYFKIVFNKSTYNPEYYKYLKEFMGHVVTTQNNSLIILQKK